MSRWWSESTYHSFIRISVEDNSGCLSAKKMMDQIFWKNQKMLWKRSAISGAHLWLHLSTSSFELSKAICASRRIFLFSTELHGCCSTHSNGFGHWKVNKIDDHWVSMVIDHYLEQMWTGERPTNNQTTSRLDDIWPEVWSNMSNHSQREARQQRDAGKTKVEDVERKLSQSFGWWGFWHRHQEHKKKIRNGDGILHAVWSTKELRKKHI